MFSFSASFTEHFGDSMTHHLDYYNKKSTPYFPLAAPDVMETSQCIWQSHLTERVVHPVLLDLGVHQVGDLLQDDVLQKWFGQMAAGRVCYVHAAPPCETWSAARHSPRPDGEGCLAFHGKGSSDGHPCVS